MGLRRLLPGGVGGGERAATQRSREARLADEVSKLRRKVWALDPTAVVSSPPASATVPDLREIKDYYDSVLLERALPNLTFQRYAPLKNRIPRDGVQFQRVANISASVGRPLQGTPTIAAIDWGATASYTVGDVGALVQQGLVSKEMALGMLGMTDAFRAAREQAEDDAIFGMPTPAPIPPKRPVIPDPFDVTTPLRPPVRRTT